MKTFRMQADITFTADTIDDALKKLADHFSNVESGEDTDLLQSGEIKVFPDSEQSAEESVDTQLLLAVQSIFGDTVHGVTSKYGYRIHSPNRLTFDSGQLIVEFDSGRKVEIWNSEYGGIERVDAKRPPDPIVILQCPTCGSKQHHLRHDVKGPDYTHACGDAWHDGEQEEPYQSPVDDSDDDQ